MANMMKNKPGKKRILFVIFILCLGILVIKYVSDFQKHKIIDAIMQKQHKEAMQQFENGQYKKIKNMTPDIRRLILLENAKANKSLKK